MPICAPAEIKTRPPRTAVRGPGARRRAPQSTPTQILVVEDHDLVRDVMARALRMAGFNVSEAASAEEARVLLVGQHFAAIVLDISLPGGLSGIQLGQWVRLRDPHIPLVFITGLLEWQHLEVVPRDAVTRYLRKPFGARVIVDFVINLLSPNLDEAGLLPDVWTEFVDGATNVE